jgi:adenylate kinase family enzyme
MLRKLHILGGPGSGKSYAARKLSAALDIPAYDLDELFWDRHAPTYGVPASPELRDHQLTKILQREAWIIEGVYHRWLYHSFAQADRICILAPHVLVRDWRILGRFARRKVGLVTSKKERWRDVINLIRWNHQYDQDQLPRAQEFIREFRHKTLCFRNADALVTYVTERTSRGTTQA